MAGRVLWCAVIRTYVKVMYDGRLGLLHINPGAAGTHGWQQERTLVKLTIDGGEMRDLEVIELGKRRI